MVIDSRDFTDPGAYAGPVGAVVRPCASEQDLTFSISCTGYDFFPLVVVDIDDVSLAPVAQPQPITVGAYNDATGAFLGYLASDYQNFAAVRGLTTDPSNALTLSYDASQGVVSSNTISQLNIMTPNTKSYQQFLSLIHI